MKRLLSLLVVIAMMVSLMPNVFAAKEEVDFDELTGRLVVLEDIAEINVVLAEGSDGMIYQWTPDANYNLSLSYTAPEGTEIAVTVTQGEASAAAADGAVSMDVWAEQVVEIEVSEAAALAAEFTISGEAWAVPGSDEWNGIFLGQTENAVTAAGTTFSGNTTWYQGYFSGTVMTITGTGAYNVIYNGETIAAVDGVVSTAVASANPRMPVVFAIDTVGEYTISFVYPVGSASNPAQLVIGENTASIEAGNTQGYYYTWIAAEEGTLTITMPSDMDWTYVINNLTTYQYGDTQCSDSDPVVNPAEIAVAAGDEIQVIVNTYDPADMWSNPAGEITFTAEFAGAAAPVVPEIVSQPTSVNVKFQETAQFAVEFSITEGATYQWQYLAADGTWKATSVAGYSTNTISVPATGLNLDGRQYRCVVTYEGVEYISEAATLTLTIDKSEVTYQPTDIQVIAGQEATFSFGDSMSGASTYQWQWSKPDSDNWANTGLYGYATTTLTVPAYEFRDGYKYRCRIENAAGVVYTDVAVLNVAPVAVISQQPMNTRAELGESAIFHVDAVGEGLVYQWQYCNAGSTNWMDTKLDGYNTDTLTVTANLNTNGRMYRCRIRNAYYENAQYDSGVHAQKYTDTARLYVDIPVIVTSQPADVTAATGETVQFSVVAESEKDFTYQWQYSKDGGATWLNTSYDGCTTDTLNVPATANNNGRMYRVKFVNYFGDVSYSEAATLTVE